MERLVDDSNKDHDWDCDWDCQESKMVPTSSGGGAREEPASEQRLNCSAHSVRPLYPLAEGGASTQLPI